MFISFEPQQMEYLDFFEMTIKIRIPNYLLYMTKIIILKFNESYYDKVRQNELNFKLYLDIGH